MAIFTISSKALPQIFSLLSLFLACSAFTCHQTQRHRQHPIRTSSTTSLYSSASAVSSNPTLQPGIALIDEYNDEIGEKMYLLRESPYFRLFCVDILASCEYMPQELFECYSETCEVYPVDEEEVRCQWRWKEWIDIRCWAMDDLSPLSCPNHSFPSLLN